MNMSKKNLITIIIPVYNIEEYIEKCIQSIINQFTPDVEILIINDGSTDHSIERIKKYENNETIKILNKKNGGLSSARNYGLKFATGKYVWFVDGDDYIAEDSISCLLELIKNNDYDIISFNHKKVYSKKSILICERLDNFEGKLKLFINTSPCTKIFNLEFLKNNNALFDEGIIYEDLALIPYLMIKATKILHLETPFYCYVFRNNSIMNNKKFNKNRDDKFKAINFLKSRLMNDELYNIYISEFIYLTIRHLLITYSTEILIYEKDIYYDRCNKVNNYLFQLNNNWINNEYLKQQNVLKKIYVYLFYKRKYYVCKLIVKILKRSNKI